MPEYVNIACFMAKPEIVTAILIDQVNDVKKKFIILDVTWREKSPQTEFASYFLLSLYYWQVLS